MRRIAQLVLLLFLWSSFGPYVFAIAPMAGDQHCQRMADTASARHTAPAAKSSPHCHEGMAAPAEHKTDAAMVPIHHHCPACRLLVGLLSVRDHKTALLAAGPSTLSQPSALMLTTAAVFPVLQAGTSSHAGRAPPALSWTI